MEERDFFRRPFTREELKELLGDRPASELFAWRSPALRALGLAGREWGQEEMVELMTWEPRLIRRPIIKLGRRLIIGAELQALEDTLG